MCTLTGTKLGLQDLEYLVRFYVIIQQLPLGQLWFYNSVVHLI